MNCPSCVTELKISDRSGIEIDYCPSCRGVWLDRGELDKIIERAASGAGRDEHDDDDDDDRRRDYRSQPPQGQHPNQPYPHKRKKSFWGELFDFD